MTILLVEDDPEICEMLKSYLTAENFEIICAPDGQEACQQFDTQHFDLVLLDLMIPKISGMDVLQHIRKTSFIPVIIISAKESETDKTLGLALGADDYITKPFSVVELLARIKSNIRRATQYSAAPPENEEPDFLTIGALTLHLSDYTAEKSGKRIVMLLLSFAAIFLSVHRAELMDV